MRSVKRIEIFTGAQEFPLVEQILESHGITGYMVLHDVEGKGNRHLDSVDALTGAPESRLIMTTCPPEAIDDLVEALRPILTRFGGACIVYDAQSLVIGSRFDPKTGATARAEV